MNVMQWFIVFLLFVCSHGKSRGSRRSHFIEHRRLEKDIRNIEKDIVIIENDLTDIYDMVKKRKNDVIKTIRTEITTELRRLVQEESARLFGTIQENLEIEKKKVRLLNQRVLEVETKQKYAELLWKEKAKEISNRPSIHQSHQKAATISMATTLPFSMSVPLLSAETTTSGDQSATAPEESYPKFGKTSELVMVKAGNEAVLPCTVEGLQNYHVLWLNNQSKVLSFEDRRITADERIGVERPYVKEWNLHIRNVMQSDSGVYRCSINAYPTRFKWVRLSVLVPPNVVSKLDKVNLKEGETAELICNVTGIPQPNVTWYKLNYRLASARKEKIGLNSESLIIRNVTQKHDDKYECVVDNGVPPSSKKTIRVSVDRREPKINTTAGHVIVKAGMTAILPCTVDSIDNYVVVWTDKWRRVISLNDRRIIDNDRISLERPYINEMNLHIRNVKPSDSGVYRCIINTFPVKVRVMRLSVFVPPNIISKSSTDKLNLKEGQTAELICNVTGFPQPNVTWYKLNYRLSPARKERIGLNSERLIIRDVTRQHDDKYECLVDNGVSPAIRKTIRVVVEQAQSWTGDCWRGFQCNSCDPAYVGRVNSQKFCCPNCEPKGLILNAGYRSCHCNRQG